VQGFLPRAGVLTTCGQRLELLAAHARSAPGSPRAPEAHSTQDRVPGAALWPTRAHADWRMTLRVRETSEGDPPVLADLPHRGFPGGNRRPLGHARSRPASRAPICGAPPRPEAAERSYLGHFSHLRRTEEQMGSGYLEFISELTSLSILFDKVITP